MIEKNRRYTVLIDILRMLDVCAIILSGLIAYVVRFDSWLFSVEFVVLILFVATIYTVSMILTNGYEYFRPLRYQYGVRRTLFSLLFSFSLLLAIGFAFKNTAEYSRLWSAYWVLFTFAGIFISRFLSISYIQFFNKLSLLRNKVFIVSGNSKYATDMTSKIKKQFSGSEYLIASESCLDQVNSTEEIRRLLSSMRKIKPDIVILVFNDKEFAELDSKLDDLEEVSTILLRTPTEQQLTSIADNLDWVMLNDLVFAMRYKPAMGLRGWWVKRVYDWGMALIAAIVFSPVIIVIALIIKLTSKGPVLFKQLRHGLNGEEFYVYKFRSMYLHVEDANTVTQAKAGDSRITKIGAFIRKTSLDELPQLLNVLKGEMSLVGPRPHAVQHNMQYKEKISKYVGRHRVKPGITGWAQVNGFRGETDTDEKMEMRVKYDIEYIKNWSVAFDLKILFLTIFVGFINKNAY